MTLKQHIHSVTCVERFADKSRLVWVRRKPHSPLFAVTPENALFCADRAWDQGAETGLFSKVEIAFQGEADSIVRTAKISNHRAVTEYFVVWRIRADLAAAPPGMVKFEGIKGTHLTKDQEEHLERNNVAFMRPEGIPGRFQARLNAIHTFNELMGPLRNLEWGVIEAVGAHFICPDVPPRSLFIPLTPRLALAAGSLGKTIDNDMIDSVNVDLWNQARQFVFGENEDIHSFDVHFPRI